ncbi:MAG: hypothetical protein HRU72_05415 [Planctomycetia bacterium]|uniref:Uncharacterized protein n=1 Tax=Candidatus Brocadia sapporoensis TaxID=392547 RepID=A0A1V6M2H2_9BACT|nr:hypothetical protein [Candidatus Brocadia sapporoensis]MCC7239762.1 hypothetical protein [Candidatus Brocadia sp.]QOJ06026.1 MAG: hypothetical protein HRU72_05415 [Planctomycetia bacterium]TVL95479.1 MAG: hypothetical protein CV082_10835 [Candidatus Brocadia sp. BL1]MDG6004839.1 hypothetical protein [Candidatus Brocadia sp.]OQD46516.1 hypothetical protein BIY37_02840 [Candidatus Brocadia sapporoensis]
MKFALYLIDALVFLLGVRKKKAKNSFHEVDVFTFFLITLILMSSIMIVEAINSLKQEFNLK